MHRSAFASVLALVTLAIAGALVTSMAIQANALGRTRIVASHQNALRAALSDAERFACTWIDRHRATLVMPPSGGALLILDHRWHDDKRRACRLAVALLDICATLPPAALMPGHPLRLAMPSPSSGPRIRTDPTSIPAGDLLEAIDVPLSWRSLPQGIPQHPPVGSTIGWTQLSVAPLVVAWFAPDHAGAINANTAPASILRAVARDRLDADRVLAERAAGSRWSGPSMDGAHGMQICSSSIRWHVLIEARIADRTSVRWAVGDGAAGQMQIIRRHDATPRPASATDP